MQEIDRDIYETDKRLRRGMTKGTVFFSAVLFLLLIASGAYADQICSDCHDTGPHGASCDSTNCASCHTAKNMLHPAGSGTPSGCAACHTTTPHPIVGAGTDLTATCVTSACHGAAGTAHLFTGTQLAPYRTAIHSGFSVLSTSCSVCHGAGGSNPSEHYTLTATCTNCHTARPGVASTMVLAHPAGGPDTSASGCSNCHTAGVKPAEADVCSTASCHGTGGIAHTFSEATLAAFAQDMHQPGAAVPSTDCQTCHTTKTMPPRHPSTTGAPTTCEQCHTLPGAPVGTAGCIACHITGAPNYSGNLHDAPIVNTTPTGCTTNFTAGGSDKTVTFTDASVDPDYSPMVYVNWGDGSPLEVRALGYAFTKTYASYGTYNITKTVKDNQGANCVATMSVTRTAEDLNTGSLTITTTMAAGICSKYPTSITTLAQCTTVAGVWTTPAPAVTYNYTVKQGGLTKKTGSAGTAGSPVTVTGLPATGTYQVYLTYPSGHTCTFTQGTTATGAPVPNVTATNCR